ncbi:hypothetical protein D1872_335010 [compost metagenome]
MPLVEDDDGVAERTSPRFTGPEFFDAVFTDKFGNLVFHGVGIVGTIRFFEHLFGDMFECIVQ